MNEIVENFQKRHHKKVDRIGWSSRTVVLSQIWLESKRTNEDFNSAKLAE